MAIADKVLNITGTFLILIWEVTLYRGIDVISA